MFGEDLTPIPAALGDTVTVWPYARCVVVEIREATGTECNAHLPLASVDFLIAALIEARAVAVEQERVARDLALRVPVVA